MIQEKEARRGAANYEVVHSILKYVHNNLFCLCQKCNSVNFSAVFKVLLKYFIITHSSKNDKTS